MIRLSALADEISPILQEQIDVLVAEGIRQVDVRGVWDTNVLDLTDDQARRIKEELNGAQIAVAAIASPLGKGPVDSSVDAELERLGRAIHLARTFETSAIRIFSYYPPRSDPRAAAAEYRSEVVNRLCALVDEASRAGVTLQIENDAGVYGESVERCTELLDEIRDSHLCAVLDPANFLLSGEVPFPDGYEALKHRLAAVHVKDATAGCVTVAGQGDGRFPEMLERMHVDGFDGVFSLEPHLQSAGRLRGFTGPERFRQASQAFQHLLRSSGWSFS